MQVQSKFKKLLARAKRDPAYLEKLHQGLTDIRTLVEEPNSTRADEIIEEAVDRHNAQLYEIVAREGLVLHPRWPLWVRAVQVRFIQLACADVARVAIAVHQKVEEGQRPSLDRLMGEVFRLCFVAIFAWSKAKRAYPRSGDCPKAPERYWNEAIASLNGDMGLELKAGRTIEQAPRDWYMISGIDYSMEAIPSDAVSLPPC